MRLHRLNRVVALAVLLAAAIGPRVAAAGETFVGTNIESRVLVGFAANTDAVQTLFPEGWTSTAFPSGPLAGANLLLAMIDTRLSLDAEGAPSQPPARRTITVVGLGRQVDGPATRMFVLETFTTAPDLDPYGNAIEASVARVSALTGPADGARESEDFWRMLPEVGGQIVLRMNYTTGRRSWSTGDSQPFSIIDTDFSEIYRYEQLADVVMSKALGKPMDGTLRFTSTLMKFAKVFDGTEEIVAVIDLPVYIREVYRPE